MSNNVFYARALVRFTALLQMSRERELTREVTDVAVPVRVVLKRNDYNTADTCEIEFDALSLPVLPRLIRQIHIQLYAGDARRMDLDPIDLQDDDNLILFVGYAGESELSLSEDESVFTVKATDYTNLLLKAKWLPQEVYPTFRNRLDEALRRILDEIPGGENIKLMLVGLPVWPMIGAGLPAGVADAAVPAKPDDSAWHLIKRACDPVALVPRIELDTLIVSTSRGLLNNDRHPVFVYGAGITSYKEKRHFERIKEGIGLRGYDLKTRKYITAVYPPPGDAAISKKKKPATKKRVIPKGVPGVDDKRQWFPYGFVDSQEALNQAAERLYHERSRQEFEGHFTYSRMRAAELVDDASFDGASDSFDVTKLANGDRVVIFIDSEHHQVLTTLASTEARVQWLVDRGYADDFASAIVQAFEEQADGPLEVYVKTATHTFSEEEGYLLEVEFQNILTVSKG